jgi:urease accessory protein
MFCYAPALVCSGLIVMFVDDQRLLRLLHIADSALPIGATAHSFGLETLVAEGVLSVEGLEPFLREYMQEAGAVEALFCRLGHRLASLAEVDAFAAQWLALNEHVSALKTSREGRAASATLGRRLLHLALTLEEHAVFKQALEMAKRSEVGIHSSVVFGLVGGVLEVDEQATVLAFLRQFLAGLVSCCQRLLPLGQSQAGQILWKLYPILIVIASRSEAAALHPDSAVLFTPLPDLGSFRHPHLTTRLFIS